MSSRSQIKKNEQNVGEVPASPHITVMLNEAVEGLAVKPSGIYVDGTFGRGGHSRKILEQLGKDGRLIAFDRDLAAIASAEAIQDPRFHIVHSHFAGLAEELVALGVNKVDGILLDLGISSPQIDVGERGFSFRFDGPLDMLKILRWMLLAVYWFRRCCVILRAWTSKRCLLGRAVILNYGIWKHGALSWIV